MSTPAKLELHVDSTDALDKVDEEKDAQAKLDDALSTIAKIEQRRCVELEAKVKLEQQWHELVLAGASKADAHHREITKAQAAVDKMKATIKEMRHAAAASSQIIEQLKSEVTLAVQERNEAVLRV